MKKHSKKRNSIRWLTVVSGLCSLLLIVGATTAVMVMTYADRETRNAERSNVRTLQWDGAACTTLSSPDEIQECTEKEGQVLFDQEHASSDLRAQQDMAAFAHGLLWFGALSFLSSVGGLVALVWTFSETRRMTSAQERAYLELVDIAFQVHGTYGAKIELWMSNSGRTPAENIVFEGELETSGVDDPELHAVHAELSVLPGNSTRAVVGRIPGFLIQVSSFLGDYSGGGSHARNTLTTLREDPDEPTPTLTLTGELVWQDIYGKTHTIRIEDAAELHFDNTPTWIGSRTRPGRPNAD